MSDGRSWEPGHDGPLDKHSFLTAMAHHLGKERGITASKLVTFITNKPSTARVERQLRELIVQLRNEGFHVCGYPGTGYYMAKDDHATCITARSQGPVTINKLGVNMPLIPLERIEKATNKYANGRDMLAHAVNDMQIELLAVQNKHLKEIKLWARKTKTAEATLEALVKDNPDLFTRPKTLIISGIKVGYKKDKDQRSAKNIDKTIKLIRKHMPDQEEVLIKVEESLIKNAIGNLDAEQLKLLGIKFIPGKDQIIIKPTDSEVDKLVAALLKETKKEI